MIQKPALSGCSGYVSQPEGQDHIFVAVACRLGRSVLEVGALLDTGSEWCVASPVEFDSSETPEWLGNARIHTRFGLIEGYIGRAPLTFQATEGEELRIDATWFISDDWNGPVVVGWKGCLERMNFALDTGRELFWFGPQEVP